MSQYVPLTMLACLIPAYVRVDPWETQQDGWTRTANVLKHFQETINASKGMYSDVGHEDL